MKNWIWISFFVSSAAFAMANEPIQRVDLTNLLWNGGGQVTQTALLVTFSNGTATPCYTATLAFQHFLSVYAGIGQACDAPITEITLTPLASAYDVAYLAPDPMIINANYYSTQIVIDELTSPVFDPANGALLSYGTVNMSVTNH